MKTKIGSYFTENLSYKFVSLLIAFILWITILGRRDFTLSKNIEVELQVGAGQALVSQSVDFVKVKVAGPRTALKKFMDSGLSQLINLDVSQAGSGDVEVDVPLTKIDVPFGVKVLSVKPSTIKAKIVKTEP